MIISACLIVKDDSELDNLRGAIDSIISYVDGVYITTTGEKTAEIIKFCKTYKYKDLLHHSHFAWNKDFSAARNFNFAQAPESNYIFWMDADDRLVNGQYLREIAEIGIKTNHDVIFLEYWYACNFDGEPSVNNIKDVQLTHQRERLIRPHTIEWKGRLHETPVPRQNVKHTYTSVPYKDPYVSGQQFPVAIAHMAVQEGVLEKMQRNQEILEMQLAEERKNGEADPRTLLYLMKIYAELDDPKKLDECIAMGEEYLRKSGWDEERGTCWELLGQVYGKKGDHRMAIKSFQNAIGEWPHNILFYVRLASAYFNVQDYRNARHWLDVGSKMDLDKKFTSGMINYHAIKSMFAELLVKLNYNVDKDISKAYEAAKLLYSEVPSEDNKKQLIYLESSNRLNDACRNLDQLSQYLFDIGREDLIVPILDNTPDVMQDMPFSQKLRKKFTPSKRWAENEICYFANFNQKHFSKWDSSSMDTGIGGSETAVVKLSEALAKRGWVVTVYGDPITKGVQNGVKYLPWFYFNIKDYFNVFIQWRGWQLAEHIKCKKFYVDLHDIYSAIDLSPNQLNNVDKFMVKSQYQRDLAPTIPDSKFCTIPHGL